MKLFYKIKRTIACSFVKKRIPLNIPEAMISFSFDDIPDSAITNGARILHKYGYKGTYYVSLDLKANNDSSKAYFDHSLLKQIVQGGHELACHTANHLRFYHANRKQIMDDLNRNQQRINELIPGYTFRNFSYPAGEQTFRSKLILKKLYKSARGVSAGLHVKNVDLYNLYANELGGDITLEGAFALIDEAIKNNAWLIFYTHEVEANPTKYGCTPEFFEQVVNYCHQKQLVVRTINEALNRITTPEKYLQTKYAQLNPSLDEVA